MTEMKTKRPYKEVGYRIADLRREASRTSDRKVMQRDGAAAIGVVEGTWTAWERGYQRPVGDNLFRVAEYFSELLGRDIKPHYILNGPAESEPGGEQPDGVFLSMTHVKEFIGGIAPEGEATELKLDSLEAYRKMVTARAPLPRWWPELRRKIEDGEI